MTDITKPIYLDYNSTTPVDPQVFAAMEPYFKTHFGNPASFAHQWGWAAQKAVEKSREQVASLISAKPLEITFTAGATESNNWVIFALAEKLRSENPESPIHFVTSELEHSSVMNTMKEAERRGIEVDFVKGNKYGQVSVEAVARILKPHTKLLSFIWVNNEIGSINPMKELAQLAKEKKIYLHTDATQALGKIPVSVQDVPVDLLSASAHKFYGPKGAGILYTRSSQPKVILPPYLFGGGQEHGHRSGTLNVPAIVGLGAAAELCQKLLPEEMPRLIELRNYLWNGIQNKIPAARLNGHPTERSPINLSLTFPGKNIEQLLPKLGRLGFSQGSACHTGTLQISPMLAALGLTADEAQGTLRLSLGRWTTTEELDIAIEVLSKALN
ncbi:cysteine desulfurase family protein [Bdellovibrio sp. HCB337]|uniref:cysteine desulfurase family protein n=1 Tax=Bdellovibrio sp. HCB337 TaxID=3394358 RepID=UPI0039A4B2B2